MNFAKPQAYGREDTDTIAESARGEYRRRPPVSGAGRGDEDNVDDDRDRRDAPRGGNPPRASERKRRRRSRSRSPPETALPAEGVTGAAPEDGTEGAAAAAVEAEALRAKNAELEDRIAALESLLEQRAGATGAGAGGGIEGATRVDALEERLTGAVAEIRRMDAWLNKVGKYRRKVDAAKEEKAHAEAKLAGYLAEPATEVGGEGREGGTLGLRETLSGEGGVGDARVVGSREGSAGDGGGVWNHVGFVGEPSGTDVGAGGKERGPLP